MLVATGPNEVHTYEYRENKRHIEITHQVLGKAKVLNNFQA